MDKGAAFADVARYYMFFLPFLWMQLSPLAILIGVWFSVGHLAQDREIMAMRLSGISALRIAAPLIITGFTISCLCLIFNINFVSFCEEKKEQIWKGNIQAEPEYLSKSKTNFTFTSQGIVYLARHFNGKNGKMGEMLIVSGGNYSKGDSYRITAKEVSWENGRWILRDGTQKIFDENGEIKQIEEFKSKESELRLSPRELWLYNRSPSIMPLGTLKKYIVEYKNSLSRYPYLAQLHARFSLPFINFTLLLMSIPFCILSLHQNAAGRMSWALGLALAYYVLFSLMMAISENGTVPPGFGLWLPNVLFLCVGVFYLWKKK
jgi:lipopolysaccharide export system permease protein